MSVASEINRLQTAKADLKTAIEGKGVTVPSSTKLDGYAALVDSIEAGGGDDDNWYIVVDGAAKYIANRDPYRSNWRVTYVRAISTFISQEPNINCWLEYKGEKYYVDSFSNGAQITKQGSPHHFYNGDYSAIIISNTATEGVYKFSIYDD